MSGSVDSVTTKDYVGRYLRVMLSPGLDLGDLHLLPGAIVISRPKLCPGALSGSLFLPLAPIIIKGHAAVQILGCQLGPFFFGACYCWAHSDLRGLCCHPRAIMTTGPKLLLLAMSGFVIPMHLGSLLMFVAQVTTGYEGCAELSRGEPAPPLEGTCLPFSHHHTWES